MLSVDDRVRVTGSVPELEGATGTIIRKEFGGRVGVVYVVRLDEHVKWGWPTPTFSARSLEPLTQEPITADDVVFTYMWVNDGGWHSDSPWERAMKEAHLRCGYQFEMLDVNIERIPCDSGHTDLCFHANVTVKRMPRSDTYPWKA